MSAKKRRSAPVVWPRGDLERRVSLDGVAVVLVRRGGVWAVDDPEALASEAALLGTLGQPTEAAERASGVVAALNAQLVRPDQLSGLVRRLATLEAREHYRYWHLGRDERDALAVACAHLGSDAAWEFLLFALAKRLEPALWRTWWVPPGPHGWGAEAVWEFDRGIDGRLGSAFFGTLGAHPQQRFGDLAVVTDPHADPADLEAIAAQHDWQIRDLVAVNPSTPPEVLKKFGCFAACNRGEHRLRLRVLQNAATPASLVEQAAVAECSTRYSADFDADTAAARQRVWAALHPRVPKRLLRTLASYGHPWVRSTVADSVRAPARVLEALAPSLDMPVRAAVARNPTASAGLLERLAADPHRRVRAWVAANSAAPANVLTRLAEDAAAVVRCTLAANEAVPAAALRALCQDLDVGVVRRAVHNPSADPAWAAPAVRRLARSKHWQARAAAAASAHVSSDLLGMLAADPHARVRHEAAANPRTPVWALDALVSRSAAEGDLDTLMILLRNDSVGGDLRSRAADTARALQGPPPQWAMTPAEERFWSRQ